MNKEQLKKLMDRIKKAEPRERRDLEPILNTHIKGEFKKAFKEFDNLDLADQKNLIAIQNRIMVNDPDDLEYLDDYLKTKGIEDMNKILNKNKSTK